MKIINRMDEFSGTNVVRFFPYLAPRLDAIKELKTTYRDIGLRNGIGKHVLATSKFRERLGSTPLHVVYHMRKVYGDEIFHDEELQRRFFRENPEWSFTYG